MNQRKFPRFLPSTALSRQSIILSLLILLLSGYAIWGAAMAPFHPDESTYLYMSSDFEFLISQPGSLAYDPGNSQDDRQRYRLIDAPLTRYYLGLVRSIFGLEAPTSDWDWSASWDENREVGAFPNHKLLQTSRIAISLLFPVCLLLVFLIGRELQGYATGVVAALLFAMNALVLLHNRRAMAEGWLTTGVLLTIWGALQAKKRPWLAGLGAAVAFNAKHSGLLLFPVVLFVILWQGVRARDNFLGIAKKLAISASVFFVVTALLNPVFWKNPLQSGLAAWEARTDLVARQVADSNQHNQGGLAPQALIRLGTTIANLYLAPLAFYEVGNYAANTAASQQAYLEIPGHNLLRSPIGAGILLFLTLFGLSASLRLYRRMPDRQKNAHLSLWLAGLFLLIGSLVLVPLSWQRYVIPLAPFTSLWIAFGITQNKLNRQQLAEKKDR